MTPIDPLDPATPKLPDNPHPESLPSPPQDELDIPVVEPVAGPDEDIVDVTPLAEEPPHLLPPPLPMALAAQPPGPGFWASLGWVVLFVIFQVVGEILLFVVFAVIVALQISSEGMKPDSYQVGQGVASMLKEQPGASIMLLVLTMLTVIFSVSLTLLLYRDNFRRYLAIRGINRWHLGAVLLLVPPGYVIIIAVYVLASRYLTDFGLMKNLEEMIIGAYWPLLILAGSIFPGVGEEVLCRGFLGRGLVAKRGVIFGVFLASTFFALMHVLPPRIAYTLVMGAMLHVVYLTTKTLLAPIILHASHNAMAFFLPQVAKAYPDSLIGQMETPGQLSPLLLGAAIAAEITLLLFLFRTRIQWKLPSGEVWSPGYVTAEMPHPGLKAVPRRGPGPWWAWLLAIAGYGFFVAVVAYQLTKT